MPVTYTKTSGQGHVYQVPDYPEAADGPKAFKDFADYLDLILPPVGTLMPFVGSTAPTGWLLCDGSSYSSTVYPKLSALCGTKFGTAAAGLFKVPDLRGRSVVGYDSSQTEFDTLGKTGGAKTVTLTVSNLPAHDHSVPSHSHTGSATGESGHTHGAGTLAASSGSSTHTHTGTTQTQVVTDFTETIGNNSSTGGAAARVTAISKTRQTVGVNVGSILFPDGGHTHTMTGDTGAGVSHTHNLTLNASGSGTTGSSGSGSSVNTISPYLTLNHIIRAA